LLNLQANLSRKMKISEEIETIMEFAREEAMRTGYFCITPDHIFLGILREGRCEVVKNLEQNGIDLRDAKAEIESAIFRSGEVPYSEADSIRPCRETDNLLSMAIAEAVKDGDSITGCTHILKALLCDNTSVAGAYLHRHGFGGSTGPGAKQKQEPVKTPANLNDLLSIVNINSNIVS